MLGSRAAVAFATVKVVDINGIKISDPSTVTFKWFQSGDSVVVKENETGDYDTTHRTGCDVAAGRRRCSCRQSPSFLRRAGRISCSPIRSRGAGSTSG
jgi:hypothetical protein